MIRVALISSIIFIALLINTGSNHGEEVTKNISGTWKMHYLNGPESFLIIEQKGNTFSGKIRSLGVDIISFAGIIDSDDFEFKEKIPTSNGDSFYCISDGKITKDKLLGKTNCAGQFMGSWKAEKVKESSKKVSISDVHAN